MDVYKLKHLTGLRLRVFLAAAEVIVPSGAGVVGAGTLHTAGVVDHAMGRLDPRLRGLFLKFLVLVEVLGIFFGGKPFSRNSLSARERQLRWMEQSSVSKFRLGFFGLKSYVCMGYYTREDIWPEIGFGGPHVAGRPYADGVLRALCEKKVEVRE